MFHLCFSQTSSAKSTNICLNFRITNQVRCVIKLDVDYLLHCKGYNKMIFRLGKREVQIADGVFVAPDASVIGAVELKKNASVWFKAVIRGDNELISIGEKSNIQDGSILHTDPGYPLMIGKSVTVGHKVMLHGCTIGDCSLIGINSVVMNGAKIGKYCLIGAGALITEGKEIPDGSLVLGSPGKVVRSLSLLEKGKLALSANLYVSNAKRYLKELASQQ